MGLIKKLIYKAKGLEVADDFYVAPGQTEVK